MAVILTLVIVGICLIAWGYITEKTNTAYDLGWPYDSNALYIVTSHSYPSGMTSSAKKDGSELNKKLFSKGLEYVGGFLLLFSIVTFAAYKEKLIK